MKKYLILFITILLAFYSCEEGECLNNEKKSKIVSDYIDDLDIINLKEGNYIVTITEDFDKNYPKYEFNRINLNANLLSEDMVPNKVDFYKYKIAYFTHKIEDKDSVEFIKNELKDKGYYHHKDSVLYRSNFPEWVLILNKENNCKKLIKDTKYQSIKDILNRYGSLVN